MGYIEFKKKPFRLEKDAIAWTKKMKKEYAMANITLKIETNYSEIDNSWIGIVYVKQENEVESSVAG